MSTKLKVLTGLFVVAVIGTFVFIDPVSQPAAYHDFADKRGWLGIPNFLNVMSNLAYLIPGLLGLFLVQELQVDRGKFMQAPEALPFYVVFLGSVLLSFGSGFYHLYPSNETLVADRLAMTIGFMGVLAFMVAERVSTKTGRQMLPALLVIGLFSVIYWIFTENMGQGDLRLYGLVQFLPMVIVLALLIWFPARYAGARYIWWALGSYALAKVFEHFDRQIWEMLQQLLSGHTLKHIVSGVGIFYLALYVKHREAITCQRQTSN